VISKSAARVAVQISVVSLASYLCGFYFTSLFHPASGAMGGLWSVISVIVVLQATRRNTLSSAWLRILGTGIGAIVSAAYLFFLPFSPIGMAATILITVLLCHAARIPDHARLAAITVVVIMVVAGLNPALNPVLSATLRFCESCIGTAMAVLAVLIWSEGERATQHGVTEKTRDL
jgi:uncharacterized membrane protein YccC